MSFDKISTSYSLNNAFGMGKEFVGKVVLVGAANAGKTSLVTRFVSGDFPLNVQPSTQPAFNKKKVTHKGRKVTLEIWDTAGQERYHALSPLFYREAHVGIVVYDVTDLDSLVKARNWAEELRSEVGDQIGIVLAGNKIDCEAVVSLESASKIAEALGAKVVETSARTGEGVDMLFYTAAGFIAELTVSQAETKQTIADAPTSENCRC